MTTDQRANKLTLQPPSDWPGVLRITKPATTWAQLGHAAGTLSALKNVCQEFKPGQGLMCLFAGERGTGKTRAAQAVAKQLGRALVRVDLSAVVSKYIGETEKNLNRLFDAAETQGAVLFFDEADALFGKRSDVADSHDRYSNIEVAYLLQRMQAHRGLSILASNHKHAVDDAFLPRFRHVIDFPT